MITKTNFISFLSFYFLTLAALGNVWQTSDYGYWNSPSTWQGGIIPPFDTTDTLLIHHHVILTSTLNLNYGAYVKIDSLSGGLCGHEKMVVNGYAQVDSYGILELDTLAVLGGIVNCENPGYVILTHYGIIAASEVMSPGAGLYISSFLEVGPWFECKLPEYSFAASVEESVRSIGFNISPNPFSTSCKIQFDHRLKNARLLLYNASGQLQQEMRNISGNSIFIERKDMPGGIYYGKISDEEGRFWNIKLVTD